MGWPGREGHGMVVLDEVGRQKEGSCLSQSSSRNALCLRSHCLGWWGHTGAGMGSGGTGDAELRLWMCHEHPAHSHGCTSLPWCGALSPRGLCPQRPGWTQPACSGGRVWILASNAGCSWGREEPGCFFWVTCEVLCGTITMLTGSCSGTRTEPLEGHWS